MMGQRLTERNHKEKRRLQVNRVYNMVLDETIRENLLRKLQVSVHMHLLGEKGKASVVLTGGKAWGLRQGYPQKDVVLGDRAEEILQRYVMASHTTWSRYLLINWLVD